MPSTRRTPEAEDARGWLRPHSPSSRPGWCREQPKPPLRVLVGHTRSLTSDDYALFAAMRAGARGYLVKGAAQDEIERAVRAVSHGEVILGPPIAQRAAALFAVRPAASSFPTLTEREHEVLELVARGLDNHAIAKRLSVHEKTIRNHVSNVFTKLRVPDRPQAIVRAREAGFGHGE